MLAVSSPTRRSRPMTEAEWLTEPDFARLLRYAEPRLSSRRLRLLAVAFCRVARGLLRNHPPLVAALDAVEEYADGAAGVAELEKARSQSGVVAVQAYERYARSVEDGSGDAAALIEHEL